MRNQIFILALVSIFLISFASATIYDMGTVKSGNCISLIQTCSNCTYSNISSVYYPNLTKALGESTMTKTGTLYNRTFCDTLTTGKYLVNGHSDLDGVDVVWNYYFNVTPSGNSNNTGFFFLIIGVVYLVSFVGFFGKNEWVSMLGGMAMIALGLYTINNGIILYRDSITDIFSWTTIAIGAFFAIMSGVSVIQDNM